jgi:energy-coupling factor transport system ATP-binding protein
MTDMPTIKTEALTQVYSPGTPFEKTALHQISLEIQEGEFVGILGHTGSGKSTFIQHLNGLLRPTSGRVLFGGEDIFASKQTLRRARFAIGLVFQYPEYQLFEETVFKDIAFGPRNMGLTDQEIEERVQEAAGFVGISQALFERSPLELSGGQKRRIAIAGVIAMRPSVLILDEPTAGLDPEGRREILSNICAYHEKTGSTILLVTHDMDEIARTAQRLLVFQDGRLALDGSPAQVFSRAEELLEMGLSIPAATKLALHLRTLGLPVDPSVFTLEALTDQILLLRKGGASC